MPELTYRYRLYPTKQQATDIMRTCSCARFLYNRLLEERTKVFRETGKWKKLDRSSYQMLPFLAKVDPGALAWAQSSLETAYRKFFHVLHTVPDRYRPEKMKLADMDPTYKLMDTDLMYYPRFKKKKTTKESYTTFIENLVIEDNRVMLPFVGNVKIRFHRPIPEEAQQISCTVLKKPSGHYYLLIRLKLPEIKKKETLETPLGVLYVPGRLAIRSDAAPVFFRHQSPQLSKQIQKAQKTLKRRKKGSHGYEEMRLRLAKLYEHRVNQRRDDLHKAARQITNAGDAVYLQRPEVRERLAGTSDKRERLRQLDEAWWTFSDLVRYKAEMEGKYHWTVVSAYPLFRLCSACGKLAGNQVDGSNWVCPDCGLTLPAEQNAVKNLEALAAKFMQERMELVKQ